MKLLVCFLFIITPFYVQLAQVSSNNKPPTAEQIYLYSDLTDAPNQINAILRPWGLKSIANIKAKLKTLIPDMKNLNEGQKRLLLKEFDEIISSINTFYSWSSLKISSVEIYQRHFTEKEFQDLIAFAKTPGGAVFLKKSEVIEAEHAADGQSRSIAFESDVNKRLERLADKIKSIR